MYSVTVPSTLSVMYANAPLGVIAIAEGSVPVVAPGNGSVENRPVCVRLVPDTVNIETFADPSFTTKRCPAESMVILTGSVPPVCVEPAAARVRSELTA